MITVIIPFRDSGDESRRANLVYCRRRWETLLGGTAQIVLSSCPDGPFNRAYAINSGRKMASNETQTLVVADADTHVSQWSIREALRKCQGNAPPWFIPYNRYYNLTRDFSKTLIESEQEPNEDEFDYEHRIPSPPVPPYSDPVSGVLVIPCKAFDMVGGFDETYVGWGYEDRDFQYRMDREWGDHERTDGFAFHLWHTVAVDPFTTPECQDNRKRFNALQSRYS